MKKRLTVILAVLMLLFLAACSGSAAAPVMDTEKAWGTPTHAYEKSVYTVEIFSRVDGTDADGNAVRTDGDVLATGNFTQTLTAAGLDAQNRSTVNSSFYVQWNDDERAGANSGLRDEMSSKVIFMTNNCAPVSSEKTANLANRGDKNDSYYFSTDYNESTALVKTGKAPQNSSFLTEKSFSFKNGIVYDNEQLFYLVRAFSALTSEGAQIGFSLNSTMDLYHRSLKIKKPTPATVTAGVLSGTATVTLGDFMLDYVATEDEFPDDPEQAVTVNCYGVSVLLSEKKHGPSHRFILTDANQIFDRGGKTSKLIVSYDYLVYDEDGADQYRISYRLTDYTTQNI